MARLKNFSDLVAAETTPRHSGWATFFRVFGSLFLVFFIAIVTLFIFALLDGGGPSDEGIFYFMLILAYLLSTSIGLFFIAFLIDVLTEMRFYQKRMSDCLLSIADNK